MAHPGGRMTEEDEAFEDLAKRQGYWGMQGSRKHQILRFAENVESKGTSMTPQQIDAMKLALGALEDSPMSRKNKDAIDALRDALAEHAMSEVQRLGQEIEQCQCPECQIKPHASDCAVHSEPAYPKGKCNCGAQTEQKPVAWWNDTGTHIDLNVSGRGAPLYTAPPQRTEKKMVMWPCLIDTADFSKGTVTVVMQCEDYKVSAGPHWLSTTPPKE
jgi:hypothetical protein